MINSYVLHAHFLYENTWQLWHCGRKDAFSLKKMGGAIARNGTFDYLYRVLPMGGVIAMVRANHRDGVYVLSRWFTSVIAMTRRIGTIGFTGKDWRRPGVG